MYQLPTPRFPGEVVTSVKRLSDNTFVPFDPANTDYQQYLKWLDEGNQPTTVDE